ncbi:MAG: hypothetical protein F4Y12_03730 [Acidimicrobiaceae bacterium]|nr:hypothetical protein [Acidimicrobiaceae bacterium]MYH78896.1 hypothetical protein [Acidimicrobiaceae bacterium]
MRSLVDRRVGRRVAVAVLAALVAWPAVAVAQDTDTGAEPEPAAGTEAEAPSARVACGDAPAVFDLLCISYGLLKENYVDEPVDEDLAAAAAEGVREAGLAPRSTEAVPPCALPSPAFEQTCAEIDAVGDTAAAVWAASSAMFASLGDPNTFLMSPSEYVRRQALLNTGLPYSGIGLRLGLLNGTVACSVLSETCRLVVSEVFPGSPAERAGLEPDDVLLLIAGLAPSGSGCGLQDLPAFELGSLVPVIVERNGRRRAFGVEAAPVFAPAVASRTVAGTIGYLRLESFGAGADERVGEELETLLDSGVESIVVDLRGNLGGYLQTVVNIAGMFLDDRQVVIREASRLDTLRHLVSGHGSLPNPALLPTAVAVDGSSASASEVLTLALRDHGRATVVGTTTYGKNTGQNTWAVESRNGTLLGGARVTLFRWFGPDGTSAEGGIEPDVELDFSDCWHPIGFTRLAAAAAGLPGALPADVQMDGEPFDAVAALAEDGVLAGTECGPGRFCPGDPIPRWLAAVWLVRTVDGQDPEPISTSRFADVDAGQWWAAHVERLAELGITVGCGAEPARYCPDDPVTRAQTASFLKRAFRLDLAPPAGFTDTHGNHHAAAIDALHAAGITKGCSAEVLEFCPDRVTTRIEMALFVDRARNRSN